MIWQHGPNVWYFGPKLLGLLGLGSTYTPYKTHWEARGAQTNFQAILASQ